MKTEKTTKPKQSSKPQSHVISGSNTVANDLPYEIVTSLRLKRSKIKPGIEYQKVSVPNMPTDTLRNLSTLGVRYGVTADEIILGLIDRELADVNGGSTLSHWIPVLNL
jgi:hypothetical protein